MSSWTFFQKNPFDFYCTCACAVTDADTQQTDTHTNNLHSTDTSHFHANCGCVLVTRANWLIAFWRSVLQAVSVMSRSLLSLRSRPLLFSLRFSSLEPSWKVTVVIVQLHVYVHVYVSVNVIVSVCVPYTQTHRPCLFSPVSLRIAGAELYQVALMVKGDRERVVLDLLSNIHRVRSSGCSADLRCKC